MLAEPDSSLPKSWSVFDFGLHAFLVVNPLALGLWTFSLAPLVGGNLFVAVVLGGVVMVLGAVVYGALAASRPWTGGDYAWQTRLLDPRVGAIVTLTAWWLVVAVLAPVFGNVIVVQVLDPLFIHAGWEGAASWLRSRDGAFAASLLAIALATAFVGLGMRRAALVQRAVAGIGAVALLAALGLMFSSSPGEFEKRFDAQATELYGSGPITHGQTLYLGTYDARVGELEPVDTLRLVALVLLFGLWIGWATPLVGEVRMQRPHTIGTALARVAGVSTLLSLVVFIAIARGVHWEFWNEANNLYWGTVYETTTTTLLPTWPNPVVFAAWLSDSTTVQIALIAGMGAWVLGWIATLFLAATRVLLAAANDRVLPSGVGRMKGDSVPVTALALLVLPACGFAALDAYWDTFATWTSASVLVLGVTSAGSGIAAAVAFRRERGGVAAVSIVFVSIVVLVVGAWWADPIFGIRGVGQLAFVAALYVVAGGLFALGRLRARGRLGGRVGARAG
jgi:amino acid transporter